MVLFSQCKRVQYFKFTAQPGLFNWWGCFLRPTFSTWIWTFQLFLLAWYPVALNLHSLLSLLLSEGQGYRQIGLGQIEQWIIQNRVLLPLTICLVTPSLSNFCQKIISFQFFEMGLTSLPPIWTIDVLKCTDFSCDKQLKKWQCHFAIFLSCLLVTLFF